MVRTIGRSPTIRESVLNLLIGPTPLLAASLTANLTTCRDALVQLIDTGASPDAKTIAKLRRDLGDDLADIVLTSASLQPKAIAKFGPGVWFATDKSLQQATAWQVARLKASWFGDRPVDDLCCGIGGDAIELSRRGVVTAYDIDPIVCELAAANLIQSGASESSSVKLADVCSVTRTPDVGVHIDPDRRQSGRRTVGPQWYRPAWNEVIEILRSTDAAIVKLAPAADVPTESIATPHRVWISLAGSVREQSLVCGDAIDPITTDCTGASLEAHHAYRVLADGSHQCFGATRHDIDHGAGAETASAARSTLVDPDAAVRAAGLTESFARRHGLSMLNGPTGFLTGDLDDAAAGKMAVVGRILWHGSADDRKLRRQLRTMNARVETVKVRGSDHDPAKLTRRYRDTGDQPVTLWIGRCDGKVFAAITQST